MPSIGTVYADLVLRSASFVSEFRRAANETAANTAKMSAHMGTLSSAVTTAGKAFGGFIAAYLTYDTARRLWSLGQATIDAADDVHAAAQRIGVTAEDLQAFRFAADQANVSTGELDAAIRVFGSRLAQGKLNTGAKSMAAALDDYIQRIASAPAFIDKQRIAYEAFGRQWQIGIALAAEGAAAFANNAASAFVISDQLAKKADNLNDAWAQVSNAMSTGFATGFLEQFGKGIQKLTDEDLENLNTVLWGLGRALGYVMSEVVRFGVDATKAISQAARDIKWAWGLIREAATKDIERITPVLNWMRQAALNDIATIKRAFASITDVVSDAISSISGMWGSLKNGATSAAGSIEGIGEQIKTLLSSLDIEAALKGVVSAVEAAISSIQKFVGGLALGDALTATWNAIKSGVQDAVSTIEGAIQSIRGIIAGLDVGGALEGMWSGITDGAQGVVSAVQGAIQSVQTFVANLAIGETIDSIWQSIKSGAEDATGFVQTAIQRVSQLAADAETGVRGIISAVRATVQTDIQTFVALVKGGVQGVVSTVEAAIQGIQQFISSLSIGGTLEGIWSGIEAGVQRVVGAVGGAIDRVQEYLSSISIGSNIASIWQGIEGGAQQAVSAIATAVQSIQGLVSGLSIGDIWAGITEGGQEAIASVETIIQGAQNTIASVGSSITELGQSLYATFAGVASSLSGVWQSAVQGATEAVTQISEIAQGINEAVSGSLGTVLEVITTAMQSGVTGLEALTKKSVEAVTTFVTTLKGKVTSYISETVGGIWKAITTQADAAWKSVEKIWTDGLNTLVTALQPFKSAWDSVWGGIESAVQAVVNAIEVAVAKVQEFIAKMRELWEQVPSWARTLITAPFGAVSRVASLIPASWSGGGVRGYAPAGGVAPPTRNYGNVPYEPPSVQTYYGNMPWEPAPAGQTYYGNVPPAAEVPNSFLDKITTALENAFYYHFGASDQWLGNFGASTAAAAAGAEELADAEKNAADAAKGAGGDLNNFGGGLRGGAGHLNNFGNGLQATHGHLGGFGDGLRAVGGHLHGFGQAISDLQARVGTFGANLGGFGNGLGAIGLGLNSFNSGLIDYSGVVMAAGKQHRILGAAGELSADALTKLAQASRQAAITGANYYKDMSRAISVGITNEFVKWQAGLASRRLIVNAQGMYEIAPGWGPDYTPDYSAQIAARQKQARRVADAQAAYQEQLRTKEEEKQRKKEQEEQLKRERETATMTGTISSGRPMPPAVHITLEGTANLFTRDQVIALIDQMNDALGDGAILTIG